MKWCEHVCPFDVQEIGLVLARREMSRLKHPTPTPPIPRPFSEKSMYAHGKLMKFLVVVLRVNGLQMGINAVRYYGYTYLVNVELGIYRVFQSTQSSQPKLQN